MIIYIIVYCKRSKTFRTPVSRLPSRYHLSRNGRCSHSTSISQKNRTTDQALSEVEVFQTKPFQTRLSQKRLLNQIDRRFSASLPSHGLISVDLLEITTTTKRRRWMIGATTRGVSIPATKLTISSRDKHCIDLTFIDQSTHITADILHCNQQFSRIEPK